MSEWIREFFRRDIRPSLIVRGAGYGFSKRFAPYALGPMIRAECIVSGVRR
jgi:hypothetical protein